MAMTFSVLLTIGLSVYSLCIIIAFINIYYLIRFLRVDPEKNPLINHRDRRFVHLFNLLLIVQVSVEKGWILCANHFQTCTKLSVFN